MPAYSRASKYSSMNNAEIRVRLLDKLTNSQEALSMADMKAGDPVICNYTTQKMAHELNYLVDMGLVRKAQSKSRKCMMYKAVSVIAEQGYELNEGENYDSSYNYLY